MTTFGAVPTEIRAGIVVGSDYDEMTGGVTTSSATLVDITGCTVTVTVPTGVTATIRAMMTFQASSSGGGGARTGAWAVSIDSTDGTELQRELSGTNDNGIGAVQTQATGFTAGDYVVVGRFRKSAGSFDVNTDTAQLSALVVLE